MLGTLVLAGLCLFGIFPNVSPPSVGGNLIKGISILVAFYYGAAGTLVHERFED